MARDRGGASGKAGTGLMIIGIGLFLLVVASVTTLMSVVVGTISSFITAAIVFIGFLLVVIRWGSLTSRQKKFLLAGITVYIAVTVSTGAYVFYLGSQAIGRMTASGMIPGVSGYSQAYQNAMDQIMQQTAVVSPLVSIISSASLLLFPFGFANDKERKMLYAAMAAAAALDIAYFALLETGIVTTLTVTLSGAGLGVGQTVSASYLYYVTLVPTLIFGFAYYMIGSRLRLA